MKKIIIILSCLSVLLSACTQPIPAEISDITDPNAASANISPAFTLPPKNITSGWKGAPFKSPMTSDDNSDAERDDTSDANGTNDENEANNLSANEPAVSSDNRTETSEKKSSEDSGATLNQEQMAYKRDYESIPKGGYRGNSYTVKRGDTLFYIAWITGNDYRGLAERNKIKEPYALSEGQVLDVSGSDAVVTTKKTVGSSSSVTTAKLAPPTAPIESSRPAASETSSKITWRWPARGRIIKKFSTASKGIDISGALGDRVSAAADGRVVYAGNALPGYGNLIIIKNSDDYLTAYAHNQTILVKEQDVVKAGQKIATMGATGTASVRLHFEMRYRAQPVDPLKYLPSH